MNEAPLVSVVTPVYNGEEFLAECIESILSQTYSNWEHTIVNNCSTDRTLEIAESYAAKDPRIRVHSNTRFAPIIENHNIALRQISPDSKYCKVVFADDWLFPECISEMVKVAEMHPSAGIVGAYGLDGTRVLWDGLPYPSTFVVGRDLCRKTLSTRLYIFGTPTSLLMRSDLVRKRETLYEESNLHADHAACYDILQESDFGFVHQVLTCSRRRAESNDSFARRMDSFELGDLAILLKYGPIYLNPVEQKASLNWLMKIYYGHLARAFVRLRGREYWKYHRDRLRAMGMTINPIQLSAAVCRKVLSSLLHPVNSAKRAGEWWPVFSMLMHKRGSSVPRAATAARAEQQQSRSVAR